MSLSYEKKAPKNKKIYIIGFIVLLFLKLNSYNTKKGVLN